MNTVVDSKSEKGYKLFNFRLMLFAAVFLGLGVLFCYLRMAKEISLWWLAVGIPIVCIPLFFSYTAEGFFRRLAALLLLGCCFGVGFLSFRSQLYDFADCTPFYGETVVVGTVENRKVGKSASKLVLRDLTFGEEKVEGRMLVYLSTDAEGIRVSDKVVLHGEIRTEADYLRGESFSEENVWKKQYYKLYAEACVKVGSSSNVFLKIRSRMEQVIEQGMSETSAALTLGLLTGDMSGVDEGLVENMRYGGISHIFAVSGLNVGALFGFCLLVFAKTPLRRIPKAIRFLLVVGVLWLYSGICGFSASVVRAAVTCAVGYAVKLLGDAYDLLDALGISAIFILIGAPSQLFDVGFQLSFLACFGLVLLTKPITHVFDECKNSLQKRFPRKYTEEERKAIESGDTLPPTVGERIYHFSSSVLSASLAAQIMTAPALLLHFGFISGWSLLLNFIFVPIIDGVFTLLLLVVVLACLLPAAWSIVLLYLPSIFWSGLMLVFEAVDFSNFALTNVQITLFGCVCYYMGLTFLSDKWNLSRRIRLWLFFLLSMGFFATILF